MLVLDIRMQVFIIAISPSRIIRIYIKLAINFEFTESYLQANISAQLAYADFLHFKHCVFYPG